MSRFHQRGRNTHWSDGRPAGFGMPLVVHEGTRAWWVCLAVGSMLFLASGALFIGSLW